MPAGFRRSLRPERTTKGLQSETAKSYNSDTRRRLNMSAENKALVQHFFDQVCNKRQLGLADQLFAAHHVHHDPSSPWVGPGPQWMKDLIVLYQRWFRDALWGVHQIFGAGDRVVTRGPGRGTP